MNDNAKILVAALRSGEYKQTHGGLRDQKGYCCLGVACDVYHKETGEGEWRDGPLDLSYYRFVTPGGPSEGEPAVLPQAVEEWLGFTSESGDFTTVDYRDSEGELPESLIGLNDRGRSFEEIADTIESEPKGLFL